MSDELIRALQQARGLGQPPPECECTGEPATLANVVTVAGYALGLWWTRGGPSWAAIASAVADELDGAIARGMGQASCMGGTLDWATDVVLTAFAADRLGWTKALPLITAAQVYARARGYRPSFGSTRAAMMLYGVLKEELR